MFYIKIPLAVAYFIRKISIGMTIHNYAKRNYYEKN